METLKIVEFRRVYIASFFSSVGRWMQNVALGVFAYNLTGSPAFTTWVVSAQLFPLLALSIIGGGLADSVDRRLLLIVTQAWQAVWGLVLASQIVDGEISRPALLGIVFLIGVGQSLFAPAFTAVVPSLVPHRNLSAAIALNSMQINGSRVIGPSLGAATVSMFGIAEVFVINSATYALIIAALLTVTIPPAMTAGLSASARILGGLRLARRAPQVRVPLLVMTAFSLFCLPFIGLMPVIADLSLGVDPQSRLYGAMYSVFGIGALVGTVAVGTVLLRVPREVTVRGSLAGFSIALAAFALLSSPVPAFPILFLVGLFYFTMPTALSTYLQAHVTDSVRGRVMALWVLSFGGVISITNLYSGWLVEQTSVRFVLLVGAVAAGLMAAVVRLRPGPIVGDELTG